MSPDQGQTLARSALYKLLSVAFLPPEEGTREILSGIDRILPLLPEEERAAIAPLVARLEADSPHLDPLPEYTRLFGVGLAATPYETEYDPLASARKGHRLADLSGFYEAFGMRLAGHRKDFPDHVAAELEFMAIVSLNAARAADEGLAEARAACDDAARKFLADHLGTWAPAFADRVEAATQDRFYRVAARLLREFVRAECRFLGVEPLPAAEAPAGDSGPPSCPVVPGCEPHRRRPYSLSL